MAWMLRCAAKPRFVPEPSLIPSIFPSHRPSPDPPAPVQIVPCKISFCHSNQLQLLSNPGSVANSGEKPPPDQTDDRQRGNKTRSTIDSKQNNCCRRRARPSAFGLARLARWFVSEFQFSSNGGRAALTSVESSAIRDPGGSGDVLSARICVQCSGGFQRWTPVPCWSSRSGSSSRRKAAFTRLPDAPVRGQGRSSGIRILTVAGGGGGRAYLTGPARGFCPVGFAPAAGDRRISGAAADERSSGGGAPPPLGLSDDFFTTKS
ncbi:hypothetical protein GEV33_007233 [Tenebrio molitor]|uniref:Uncharacterized protein n=1 Tax=Tenebrio molitor TaxID=7067 RepID=A0A8J6LD75_TENMO|nr:hypothetical protein GEV33_007233 [Tenebrio molitor]